MIPLYECFFIFADQTGINQIVSYRCISWGDIVIVLHDVFKEIIEALENKINIIHDMITTIPDHILQFAEDHRHKRWSVNLLDMPKDYLEAIKWLFSQDHIGWIEIKKNIDLSSWKSEISTVNDYYVEHRGQEENKDWYSCCVHGISIDKTEGTNADQDEFCWTELANKVPTIVNFWKDFPVEKYKRLRFMKVGPGGYINIHNDLPSSGKHLKLKDIDPLNSTVSVNVAVDHPTDCEMILENIGNVPWKDGKMFIINITKNHCVINNSNKNRIHMIAECVIGNRIEDFSKLIYQNLLNKDVLSNIQ
jgi:hypothetical protein